MAMLFIFLVIAFGVALGADYDALRVRFGTSQELADLEHFFTVPRFQSEATGQGWRSVRRPPGHFEELVLLCPSERSVCGLYDSQGFIAGLQIAFNVNDLVMDAIPPEQHLVRWRPPTWPWQRTREYWTATQYFVTEESLHRGTRRAIGQTIGPEGVWVTGPEGSLINLPAADADFAKTNFTVQSCIPFMGLHYFYDMTPSLDCAAFVPWFGLTQNDAIVGSGFITFAKYPEPAEAGDRDWFERPNSAVAKAIVPNGPECLYDWIDTYGSVSLHIYYIDEPWTLLC